MILLCILVSLGACTNYRENSAYNQWQKTVQNRSKNDSSPHSSINSSKNQNKDSGDNADWRESANSLYSNPAPKKSYSSYNRTNSAYNQWQETVRNRSNNDSSQSSSINSSKNKNSVVNTNWRKSANSLYNYSAPKDSLYDSNKHQLYNSIELDRDDGMWIEELDKYRRKATAIIYSKSPTPSYFHFYDGNACDLNIEVEDYDKRFAYVGVSAQNYFGIMDKDAIDIPTDGTISVLVGTEKSTKISRYQKRWSICQVVIKWAPEKGKKYVVGYTKDGSVCYSGIKEIDENNQLKPVADAKTYEYNTKSCRLLGNNDNV